MSKVLTPKQFEALALPQEWMDKLDRVEEVLAKGPEVVCPLQHTFTPGLYTRTIKMPAGTLLTSKIHAKEHPFVILQGKVSVRDVTGVYVIEAPYQGVTPAGTRRVIYVHKDTVWATFHVNPSNTKDLDKIEEDVIFKRVNPRLGRPYKCLK